MQLAPYRVLLGRTPLTPYGISPNSIMLHLSPLIEYARRLIPGLNLISDTSFELSPKERFKALCYQPDLVLRSRFSEHSGASTIQHDNCYVLLRDWWAIVKRAQCLEIDHADEDFQSIQTCRHLKISTLYLKIFVTLPCTAYRATTCVVVTFYLLGTPNLVNPSKAPACILHHCVRLRDLILRQSSAG
jgi:hypothetical protein